MSRPPLLTRRGLCSPIWLRPRPHCVSVSLWLLAFEFSKHASIIFLACGNPRMSGSEDTLENGQCSLIHRRGFGNPQLRNAQRGEIVQGDRYIGMPRAEELLFELKG